MNQQVFWGAFFGAVLGLSVGWVAGGVYLWFKARMK